MSQYAFKPEQYKEELLGITAQLLRKEKLSSKKIDQIVKSYPMDGNKVFSRDKIIAGIKWLAKESLIDIDENEKKKLLRNLQMKPTRTISGVTTVTVLSKPFACPGKCVFCPNDVRMPKSYIATEPGAQRALMNKFSPYLQVWNRLKALQNIGHPTEKIELLVLGGTWSYYPEIYRVWFIKECFRAMNDFGENNKNIDVEHVQVRQYLQSDFNTEIREKEGDKPYNQLIQTQTFKNHFKTFLSDESKNSVEDEWSFLQNEQQLNESGTCRCVGLVLETRPDTIDETEVLRLRKLGATKIQLGIQTTDDKISELNKRGENRQDTATAFKLLRAGGFKIHAHIMPNLYGSTIKKDFAVFKELFESEDFKPDELKIYPTSIIKHTELEKLYQAGEYKPYTTQELVNLIADCMEITPEYCRLTRIIRDIPSTEIEAGNKTTNLREVVEHKLQTEKRANPNIRAREIKSEEVTKQDLSVDIIKYQTVGSTEYFLQFITEKRKVAGFLRLSLPEKKKNTITKELDDAAVIREIHVYGPSLEISTDSSGEAQHLGLGKKLIKKAREIAKNKDYKKLAVISSIGTRGYYRKRGFKNGSLYQIMDLSS